MTFVSKTLLGVMLLLSFSPRAQAQADPLQALGAPDYATRQAMTWQLLADNELTLVEVAQWYRQATSDEQRCRLLDIFRHHAIRQMRQSPPNPAQQKGSIGLSHGILPANTVRGQPHPAVYVNLTLPGFPGYAHLQPGDLILQLDGQPMPDDLTSEMFMLMIQSRHLGQRISLDILRENQPRHVSLQLASSDALGQVYARSARQLAPAFEQAWQALHQALIAGDLEALTPPSPPQPAE